MFEARYVPREGDSPQKIRVEDYDPTVHKDRLLCGDFNCVARLHYRKGSLTKGASVERSPHFVTFENTAHRPDCTHQSPDVEAAGLKNLEEALRAGHKVLINLNMKLSHAFKNAARGNTPYERFRAEHAGRYLPVSVKSVSDILSIREALKESGYDNAFSRTYIGYRGQICEFDDFFIGDNPQKLRTLFNALHGMPEPGDMFSWHHAANFPRVIEFRPTQKTREKGRQSDRSGWFMNGTPCNIARLGEPDKILLQELKSENMAMRSDILLHGSTYVLGVPFSGRQPKDLTFRTIGWQITDENQYAGAVPR
ncbi:MAG: hypothetical protein LRY54_02250 [Alphaproteobacteria bacterium]|nr:hypothetical protein [Alphaproteobacteria bacterium]